MAIGDLSLGLLAFSLSMWVILPWGFLDNSVVKAKPELRGYILRGQRFFFVSGIFFLLQSIIDLLNGIVAFPVNLFPSYDIPFGLGVICMVGGIVNGYLLFENISDPEHKNLDLTTGIVSGVLIFYVLLNDAYQLLPLVVTPKDIAGADRLQLMYFFSESVSFFAAMPLLWWSLSHVLMAKLSTWKGVVVFLIFVSPYILFLIFYYYYNVIR